MFANFYTDEIKAQLKNCLRVMPHHQDTSGFFITIIQKVKEFESAILQSPKQEFKGDKLPLTIQEGRTFSFVRCDSKDPDYQYLKSYYGLTDNFDSLQLISGDAAMNKISFISKEMSEYLYTDVECKKLSLLNIGVPLFQRNHSRFAGSECIFRINQEGILNIIPYMTKRIVKSKDLSIFKKYISHRYNGSISAVAHDKELAEQIKNITPGCFVFVYENEQGGVEAIAMHKFEFAVSSMISREAAFNFQLRYLSKEERAQATGILEAEAKEEVQRCIKKEKDWLNQQDN